MTDVTLAGNRAPYTVALRDDGTVTVFIPEGDGGGGPRDLHTGTGITRLIFSDVTIDLPSISPIHGAAGVSYYLGASVALADLNGDGFKDAIVVAGGGSAGDGGGVLPGQTYVLFGSASGLPPDPDLAHLSHSAGFSLNDSASYGSREMEVASAGDVNGDGLDDIIVTNWRYNDYQGKAFVLFGSTHGFPQALDVSAPPSGSGFEILGSPASQGLGISAASAGDINGDGIDDIVVGGFGQSSPAAGYVVFGSSTGFADVLDVSTLDGSNGFKFTAPGLRFQYAINAVSAAGDVNGDGIGDLVVSSGTTDYVLFGKTGGFDPTVDLSALNGSDGFTLTHAVGTGVGHADINGDGFSDLLVNSTYGGTRVILGHSGAFTNANLNFSVYSIGQYAHQMITSAGDINGDGFDDMLVAEPRAYRTGQYTASGAVMVVYGGPDAGVPGHPPSVAYELVGTGNEAIGEATAAGDINGDGFADLLIGAAGFDYSASRPGATYVLYGRAPGEAVTRIGSAASQTLAGGRFNDTLSGLGGDDTFYGHGGNDTIDGGDGNDTAVFSGKQSNYQVTTQPDGTKIVTDLRSGSPDGTDTLTNVENLRFEDIMTTKPTIYFDGNDDIFLVSSTFGSAENFLGDGTGNFGDGSPGGVGISTGTTMHAAVGDLNNDGILDVVTAARNIYQLHVNIGIGNGNFNQGGTVNFIPYSGLWAELGDIDGDGNLDAVAITSKASSPIWLIIGNGDGTFQTPVQTGGGLSSPTMLKLADFDGDGALDVAILDSGVIKVGTLASGTALTIGNTYTPGNGTNVIAVGDVNSDGNADIVAANSGDNAISVLLGQGDRSFADGGTVSINGSPLSLILADVNGDGKLDILAGRQDQSGHAVSVLLNDGSGHFTAYNDVVGGVAEADAIAVGDFNNDGHADLAVADGIQGKMFIFLGDGSGTNYAAGISRFILTSPTDLEVANFDTVTPSRVDEDTALVFSSANHNALTISDDGFGGDTVQLSVAHGTLTLGGSSNISVSGNGTGSVTISGLAADLNAALDGLSYQGLADYNGNDLLSVTVTDEDTNESSSGSHNIVVTPVNDAPAISGVGAAPITFSFTEGDGPIVIAGGLTVSDVDSVNLTGATVQISTGFTGGDILGFTDTANIQGSYDATTGLLTLTGIDTVANYQAALQSVTFGTVSDDPTVLGTHGSRHFDWSVTDDGGLPSNAATSSFRVTGVDDAPVIDLNGASPTYTENDPYALLAPNGVVVDPDTADFNGLILAVTTGPDFDPVQDHLSIMTDSTVTLSGSLVSVDGRQVGVVQDSGLHLSITLITSDATPEAVTALIQHLTYFNSSDDPSPGVRALSISLIDSGGLPVGSPTTLGVDVTAVNDAPVGASNTIMALEDAAYTFVTADFGFTDTDSNGLAAVIISTLPSDGTLSLNGTPLSAGDEVSSHDIILGNLTFIAAPDVNGSGYATFTFQVKDDGGTANGGVDTDPTPRTLTIDVMPVNDAPSGADKTITTNEDTAHTFVAGDFGFTDPVDGTDHLLAVTITTLPGAGALTDNGVAVTAGQSVSLADITAGKLVFTPAADANGAGYAPFTFQVQDDGGTANGGVDTDPTPNTFTFNVTAVNDAPVIGAIGGLATQTILEDTQTSFSGIPSDFITDVDALPGNGSYFIAVLQVAHGALHVTGSVANMVGNDTGTVALYGSLAQINTLLSTADAVKYTAFADYNGADTLTVTANDQGSTGSGGRLQVQKHFDFTVTAQPDSPNGTDGTVTGLEDAAYTFGAADFGFNDADGDHLLAVKITTLPAAGTLTDNGVAVTAGQYIPVADIAGGLLRFTPVANGTGSGYASFTFQVQDDSAAGGGLNLDQTPNTVTIDVTPVNDRPVSGDTSITTLEDTTYVFSASDFVFTDPNDSPANGLLAVRVLGAPVSGALLDDGVAVTSGQFVSIADINAGKFTYAPGANASGTFGFFYFVQDDGGTANGGADLSSSSKNFFLHVTPMNDAPSGADNTVTMLEGTAYVFAAADFGFSDAADGGANALLAVEITTLPAAGTLTDNGVAVTAGQFIPVADINAGLLAFTPAANVNGSGYASFTFQVQDNGGTANGGVDIDPTPRTIAVDVTSVNDAPAGANNTVTTLEDTGYTFAAADFGFSDPNDSPANTLLAVAISTLPAAGTLTDNGVAVTAGQFVSIADITGGKLVFTPAANANGSGYASFTFQVQDNGGTANGGVDIDPTPGTMTIDVTSVNDAPAGVANTVTTLEDTAHVFSGTEFGFTDPNDSSANSLLAVKIATLPAAGTLTDNGVVVTAGQFIPVADIDSGLLVYMPAANTNGSAYASFTFQVQDNGGTANGGVDVDSTPKTFTIDVTAVNDAPVLSGGGTSVVYDTATPVAAGTGLSAVDIDSTNLGQAVVTISAGYQAGDALAASLPTSGGFFIVDDGTGPVVTNIAVHSNTSGQLVLSGADTVQHYLDVLHAINFSSSAADPVTGGSNAARTITWLVSDDQSADSNSQATTITINDPAIAKDDGFTTDVATAIGASLNLFGNNGHGADTDPDGPAISIAKVQGSAASVGTQITLASGALLTVHADGTFSYDPNHAFDGLHLAPAGSGAANDHTTDTFSYTLTSGGTATVTVTVNGIDAGSAVYDGGSGDDHITGGDNGNVFHLEQGGDDSATGGAGNDGFYFGGAFDGNDHVEGGGGGNNQLGLEGDYSGGVTLTGANVTNVQVLAMMPGFNYTLTTDGTLSTAGQSLSYWSASMGSSNHVSLDMHSEAGNFKFYLGQGDDTAIGGAGNDLFYGGGGADVLVGNGGSDVFAYLAVSDSNGANGKNYDTLDFTSGTDKIKLPTAVTAIDAAASGSLSTASFDSDIAAVLGHGQAHELDSGHAVLFTATGGGLVGHVFLVVGTSGAATGYVAGQDYVIDLIGGASGVATSDFT